MRQFENEIRFGTSGQITGPEIVADAKSLRPSKYSNTVRRQHGEA
jgi:hypothetical protein